MKMTIAIGSLLLDLGAGNKSWHLQQIDWIERIPPNIDRIRYELDRIVRFPTGLTMTKYSGLANEYYVNMNLNTELELSSNRDTLLHFFEQVKKRYPTMRNFYSRERGDYVLEEDKDDGNYRWATVEQKRICSGFVNPPSIAEAVKQHEMILESIPYTLSLSPLDCESLNFMFGFDFLYRGNHHELLLEALGVSPAFEKLLEAPDARLVSNELSIQIALDDDCRTQCRLSVEPRTTAYNVRSGDFAEETLSVYFTLRRYGSLPAGETFVSQFQMLHQMAEDLLDSYVVDNVLIPLQQAIAIK